MKKLNLTSFLGMEYPIALYMVATGKLTVPLEELYKYTMFLTDKLRGNKNRTLICCSSFYLKETMQRYSHLFQSNDQEVRYIGKNMSGNDKFDDLKRAVLAYLPTDTLIHCIKYTEEYAKINNVPLKISNSSNRCK